MKVWLVVFGSVSVVNMLSLALILIFKKPDCKKNRLLAIILIIPAFTIFLNIIRYLGLLQDYSALIAFDSICSFAWPPMVFIYVKIMIGEQFRLTLKKLLHFIPAFFMIFLMSALILHPAGKLILNQFQTSENQFLTSLIEISYVILSLVYLFICRAIISKYNRDSEKSTSKLHPVSLQWLQNFIQTLIVIILIISIAAFVIPVVEYSLLFLTIATTIPYFYLLFKLMSSEHLFSEKEHDLLSQIFVEKKKLVSSQENQKISVKLDKIHILIKLSDIFFIRSENKYTRIYLKDKSCLSDYTLTALEARFPQQLSRIHRNTLVNLSKIKGIEKFTGGKLRVLMEDGSSLEVSRRMTGIVKNLFSIK